MKYYALIVAGGSGNRMVSDIPKQFLLLNSRPVLMHTIESFYHSDLKPKIIVVLNTDYFQYWKDLCSTYHFNIPHKLVKGGTQRFHSVKNGLKEIEDRSVVAVHDAVRPIISNDLITRSFLAAEQKGNAIPGITSNNSLRQVSGAGSVALSRETVLLIQTPQTFTSEILKKAYEQSYSIAYTDDASVVEKTGIKINIIQGERYNLKITYPEDLEVAQLFLKNK